MACTSLQGSLQGSLIAIGVFLVFLHNAESAVTVPKNKTQPIDFTRNILDILSRGEQTNTDERKRRYSILQEINETAESIQTLENLLKLARRRRAPKRVVRDRSWGFGDPGWPECEYEIQEDTLYHGRCIRFGQMIGVCETEDAVMGVSRECSESR